MLTFRGELLVKAPGIRMEKLVEVTCRRNIDASSEKTEHDFRGTNLSVGKAAADLEYYPRDSAAHSGIRHAIWCARLPG